MLRLVATLLLATVVAAQAETPGRRMLGAGEAQAFRGVGRLNVAGTRFCTATLVEPDVVVTAAHCLFHPRTHARVPVSELRFVAGLRRDEVAAVRQAVRAVVHPGFSFEGAADMAGIRTDLALVELDEAVPQDAAQAFRVGALADGTVTIVSYARDRAQAPSIEAPCAVLSETGGMATVDCPVNYGASGAPVLQGQGADTRLVAVVSAMGRVLASDEEVTLAVPVLPAIETLSRLLRDAAPETRRP